MIRTTEGWPFRGATARTLQACSVFLLFAVTVLHARAALGWSDHAPGTYHALSALSRVRGATPVLVETLDQFLSTEQTGIQKLLDEEEGWARAYVPGYPPRPDRLVFSPGGSEADLVPAFLRALRVNPAQKVIPYLEVLPGSTSAEQPRISWRDVTVLKNPEALAQAILVPVQPGDTAPALAVVSTASSEPDYGLDIGVWEDNGTDYGKAYGFGPQPFGNPRLEFSSQAPFHMGFYHEAWIVYRMAGFLRRTYPEHRIHLFQSLSRYAFRKGHEYWGWRFAGWGLHYVQDLVNPYHSTVLPGEGVARMLWINALATVGMTRAKENAIQLLSNRHLALEKYAFEALSAERNGPFAAVLADTGVDQRYGAYDPSYPRRMIAAEARGRADETDRELEKWLPPRMVSDPDYVLDQTEPGVSLLKAVKAGPAGAQAAMGRLLETLLRSFGAHSRVFLRAILD